jgi:hypothetical protein
MNQETFGTYLIEPLFYKQVTIQNLLLSKSIIKKDCIFAKKKKHKPKHSLDRRN